MNSEEIEQLRGLLEDATIKCSERCLYQSAKWASELLNSLPFSGSQSPADTEPNSPLSNVELEKPVPTGVVSQNNDTNEARLELRELHKYLLAKTYFDCREYDRCSAVFLPLLPKGDLSSPSETTHEEPKQQKSSQDGQGSHRKSSPPKSEDQLNAGFPELSRKSLFLALYAKYMAGEKRKDELSETILGPADGTISNGELIILGRILESRLSLQAKRKEEPQGWLEYLYGIVLSKGKNRERARHWLIESVIAYPFNWGAWQELNVMVETVEELNNLTPNLPRNIMAFIFHIFANQELIQHNDDLFSELDKISSIFPNSSFLKAQKALLLHHAKDLEAAERTFADILQRDPLRLDDLNNYSNVLYVMENRPKLAFLAQLTTAVDKFRPETCCVVGNYYSMKSEHEKAVVYFRRALTLDRNFLAAWTLMGHEYIELKNTHAAIESYRRAVDVNRKDFRAWYGLGQTYELLDMHFYALYYFERAAALASHNSQMWEAVASCYSNIGRIPQAIKAYQRALVTNSIYEGGNSFSSGTSQRSQKSSRSQALKPEILYEIAKLYEKSGNEAETKAYLRLTLDQEEGPIAEDESTTFGASTTSGTWSSEKVQGVGVTATTSKARMWLAKLEIADGKRESFERALELLNELCQDGYEVEEAKALMRQTRETMGDDQTGEPTDMV